MVAKSGRSVHASATQKHVQFLIVGIRAPQSCIFQPSWWRLPRQDPSECTMLIAQQPQNSISNRRRRLLTSLSDDHPPTNTQIQGKVRLSNRSLLANVLLTASSVCALASLPTTSELPLIDTQAGNQSQWPAVPPVATATARTSPYVALAWHEEETID
jgi:hypothetical protein